MADLVTHMVFSKTALTRIHTMLKRAYEATAETAPPEQLANEGMMVIIFEKAIEEFPSIELAVDNPDKPEA